MIQLNAMLQDISFYYQHQEKLNKGYNGRFILIKDETVMGDFCTWLEASLRGLEICKDDSFFVKFCA